MKFENLVTWVLLGVIVWELSKTSAPGGIACGGTTNVPANNVTGVLQAAAFGQVSGGALGCYNCPPSLGVYGG